MKQQVILYPLAMLMIVAICSMSIKACDTEHANQAEYNKSLADSSYEPVYVSSTDKLIIDWSKSDE